LLCRPGALLCRLGALLCRPGACGNLALPVARDCCDGRECLAVTAGCAVRRRIAKPPVIDGTLIDATKAKELTDNRGTD
jgi:hypothetical protein